MFGFHKNESKKKKAVPTVYSGPEYRIEVGENGYTIIEKGTREYCDGDIVARSPSGKYFLACGFKGNSESAFLFSTSGEVLQVKKFEDGVVSSVVTDDGTALICSDDEKLLCLSSSAAFTKSIGFQPEKSGAFLSSTACAFCYFDGGESVCVSFFNLTTGRSWKKTVCVSAPSGYEPIIHVDDASVSVERPGGLIRFTLEGVTVDA